MNLAALSSGKDGDHDSVEHMCLVHRKDIMQDEAVVYGHDAVKYAVHVQHDWARCRRVRRSILRIEECIDELHCMGDLVFSMHRRES